MNQTSTFKSLDLIIKAFFNYNIRARAHDLLQRPVDILNGDHAWQTPFDKISDISFSSASRDGIPRSARRGPSHHERAFQTAN
jgi:hypothetical protein